VGDQGGKLGKRDGRWVAALGARRGWAKRTAARGGHGGVGQLGEHAWAWYGMVAALLLRALGYGEGRAGGAGWLLEAGRGDARGGPRELGRDAWGAQAAGEGRGWAMRRCWAAGTPREGRGEEAGRAAVAG
jgi:hypothetical protein